MNDKVREPSMIAALGSGLLCSHAQSLAKRATFLAHFSLLTGYQGESQRFLKTPSLLHHSIGVSFLTFVSPPFDANHSDSKTGLVPNVLFIYFFLFTAAIILVLALVLTTFTKNTQLFPSDETSKGFCFKKRKVYITASTRPI